MHLHIFLHSCPPATYLRSYSLISSSPLVFHPSLVQFSQSTLSCCFILFPTSLLRPLFGPIPLSSYRLILIPPIRCPVPLPPIPRPSGCPLVLPSSRPAAPYPDAAGRPPCRSPTDPVPRRRRAWRNGVSRVPDRNGTGRRAAAGRPSRAAGESAADALRRPVAPDDRRLAAAWRGVQLCWLCIRRRGRRRRRGRTAGGSAAGRRPVTPRAFTDGGAAGTATSRRAAAKGRGVVTWDGVKTAAGRVRGGLLSMVRVGVGVPDAGVEKLREAP